MFHSDLTESAYQKIGSRSSQLLIELWQKPVSVGGGYKIIDEVSIMKDQRMAACPAIDIDGNRCEPVRPADWNPVQIMHRISGPDIQW